MTLSCTIVADRSDPTCRIIAVQVLIVVIYVITAGILALGLGSKAWDRAAREESKPDLTKVIGQSMIGQGLGGDLCCLE